MNKQQKLLKDYKENITTKVWKEGLLREWLQIWINPTSEISRIYRENGYEPKQTQLRLLKRYWNNDPTQWSTNSCTSHSCLSNLFRFFWVLFSIMLSVLSQNLSQFIHFSYIMFWITSSTMLKKKSYLWVQCYSNLFRFRAITWIKSNISMFEFTSCWMLSGTFSKTSWRNYT